MGYYVSHCESGSWALMQARSMQHIIDKSTNTTLCGRTPERGRWFGNPRQLTQQSFHTDDCESCAEKAVALGIWSAPKARQPRQSISHRNVLSHAGDGVALNELDPDLKVPALQNISPPVGASVARARDGDRGKPHTERK